VVGLGQTGRNFAAGMSGGIAYCLDETGDFKKKCNMDMVELEKLDLQDSATVRNLLSNHYRYTKSQKAKKILEDFEKSVRLFVKVMPWEYKRILEKGKVSKKLDPGEYIDG
jgi:glutamate synthase (ferredoxin)